MGADPDAKDGNDGKTPLHKCAAEGHPIVTEILLSAGNHTNYPNDHKNFLPAVRVFQFDSHSSKSINSHLELHCRIF